MAAPNTYGNVTRTGAAGMGVCTVHINRNNQPAFVVPVAAFVAADVPHIGAYAHGPTDRTGRRRDDGRFVVVRFGARVGRLIAALPAADRNAAIVATVATQRRIGRTIAGRGRCDMIAYDAATGAAGRDARTIAESVAASRRALRNPATRAAIARRMIADARTADEPAIAAADAATADEPADVA